MIKMKREVTIMFVGLVFFGLVTLTLFYGKGEKAEGIMNFSNSTVVPAHGFTPGPCSCPTTGIDLVAGAIDAAPLIGQIKQEGNSPYNYNSCRENAVEMLEFLNDQEIFQYAQSITRSDLGSFPPKELFFSWDQEKGKCDFFFDCPGMKECTNKARISGKVE